MKLLEFITGRKKPIEEKAVPVPLSPTRNGWYPLVRESFAGAWQQGITLDQGTVLSDVAIFRCISLLSSDVAKLRMKLVRQDSNGLWSETEHPAFSPVLRKPNHLQNRIQFFEGWMISKLAKGNAYILKERDGNTNVRALYVLDPCRVTPLVADDGSVFYQLRTDNVAGLTEDVTVPASEIIHDRWNCLFHPLVGVSPLYAATLPATTSLNIGTNSAIFFKNKSQPGGILTAPGSISDETAQRLKETWDSGFGGANAGKVAVLGDGLTYETMAVTAEAAQLVEQLKLSGEAVCSAFGVPSWKIGLGPVPTVGNGEMIERSYYSQSLQRHLEDIELCLDEGLALPKPYGTEFDIDSLLRLDSATMVVSLKDAVGAGVMAPNEARRKLDLKPVAGGESPYLQMQNYSLEALSRRDGLPDPFDTTSRKELKSDPSKMFFATGDDWRLYCHAKGWLKDGETKPRIRVPYITRVMQT
ncbi:phage portal protein [Mesorhizobium sp. WSM3879]|uniref:phage portal protein n=1 Tax=Mesorhizobium sp. WSM3879 TaxID=2029406 RepID=UPI000BB07D02|nr:phage portal protein [Mesorhizobium sp. WSM3879]PBB80968.1 phage portal protein [Mesorhizobium sp. WSM3879]